MTLTSTTNSLAELDNRSLVSVTIATDELLSVTSSFFHPQIGPCYGALNSARVNHLTNVRASIQRLIYSELTVLFTSHIASACFPGLSYRTCRFVRLSDAGPDELVDCSIRHLAYDARRQHGGK
jgi:hypothetical protein